MGFRRRYDIIAWIALPQHAVIPEVKTNVTFAVTLVLGVCVYFLNIASCSHLV